MQWQDTACVLKVIRCSEYDAVVTLYCCTHGKINGIFKGAFSKRNRPVIELGNVVQVDYTCRIEGQLGRIALELLVAQSTPFLHHMGKLLAYNSVLSMVDSVTVMGQVYEPLYESILNIYVALDSPYWAYAYCKWEIYVLSQVGYGLDLSKCAGTGTQENLIYVSPKSGRAVSAQAGHIYKSKLLPLPQFLLGARHTTEHLVGGDYYNSLQLSGYFLKKLLLDCGGQSIPEARNRLCDWMYKKSDLCIDD